jgi:hypothetical protein
LCEGFRRLRLKNCKLIGQLRSPRPIACPIPTGSCARAYLNSSPSSHSHSYRRDLLPRIDGHTCVHIAFRLQVLSPPVIPLYLSLLDFLSLNYFNTSSHGLTAYRSTPLITHVHCLPINISHRMQIGPRSNWVLGNLRSLLVFLGFTVSVSPQGRPLSAPCVGATSKSFLVHTPSCQYVYYWAP